MIKTFALPKLIIHWRFGTRSYKLQASLNVKVGVDGHGCHTALKGVNAKNTRHYQLPKTP